MRNLFKNIIISITGLLVRCYIATGLAWAMFYTLLQQSGPVFRNTSYSYPAAGKPVAI